jgi:hypothetical protein
MQALKWLAAAVGTISTFIVAVATLMFSLGKNTGRVRRSLQLFPMPKSIWMD